MSDKLKKGLATTPTFVDGETPSAAKLNSIPLQVAHATTELEKAIGDIHDESWPYKPASSSRLSPKWGRERGSNAALASTADRELAIANLARLVGPAANLNPRMLAGSTEISETIPSGVHEFTLQYPIDGATSGVTFSGDGGIFASLAADAASMAASGDYFIDAGGRVYSFGSTTGGTITYDTNPSAYAGGSNYQGATFNVYPDPNQFTAGGPYPIGLTVSALSGGVHAIALPAITHQQSNSAGTSTDLTDADVNNLQTASLPQVLVDNYTGGDEIPAGFMYLKNYTTGEVYDNATYYFVDATNIQVGGIDLDAEITANNEFMLFTVGTDITTSIDDLREKSRHSHDRSFGEPYVDYEGIAGHLAPETSKGFYVPSAMSGNFAPQYLHRDGYDASDAGPNDSNAMRGNIVMGRTIGTTGDYLSDSGSSYGIKFGTDAGGELKKIDGITLALDNNISSGITRINSEFLTELWSRAGIEVDAQNGGITLKAQNGNVRVFEGGLRVDDTDAVASAQYSNTRVSVDSGHMATQKGAVIADSILAGPLHSDWGASTLTKYESGVDSLPSGWAVPRFGCVWYAEDNVDTSLYGADPAALITGQAKTGEYWQKQISLPSFLSGTQILGVNAMVRSPDWTDAASNPAGHAYTNSVVAEGTRWHVVAGGDPRGMSPVWATLQGTTGLGNNTVPGGERLHMWLLDEGDSGNPDTITIRIGCHGNQARWTTATWDAGFYSYNDFHIGYLGAPFDNASAHGFASEWLMSIDYRICIFYAVDASNTAAL